MIRGTSYIQKHALANFEMMQKIRERDIKLLRTTHQRIVIRSQEDWERIMKVLDSLVLNEEPVAELLVDDTLKDDVSPVRSQPKPSPQSDDSSNALYHNKNTLCNDW